MEIFSTGRGTCMGVGKCVRNCLRIYASHHADGAFISLFLFMEKLSDGPVLSKGTRLSDDQLLRLCEKYGLQAKLWRQKFCGLLPEVCKRRLYEKKRFRSIFEFALILGGLSEHQVRLVLNLDKRFEEMPHLHELLAEGKVSVNKLARVVSVATVENEEFWANQCKNLSNRALEVLVNDEKKLMVNSGNNLPKIDHENFELGFASRGRNSLFGNFTAQQQNYLGGNGFDIIHQSKNLNGSPEPQIDYKSLHVQTFGIENNSHKEANFTHRSSAEPEPYNVDVHIKFMALIPKLDQKIKMKILELSEKGIDVNSVLAVILDEREQDIEHRKNEIVEGKIGLKNIVDTSESKTGGKDGKSQTASRYIPVNTRRVLQLEHGTKCSIATCSKMAEQIHHSQRFGLMKNAVPQAAHDPRYLAPLCKEHHQIAHSIDVKFGEVRKKIVQRE